MHSVVVGCTDGLNGDKDQVHKSEKDEVEEANGAVFIVDSAAMLMYWKSRMLIWSLYLTNILCGPLMHSCVSLSESHEGASANTAGPLPCQLGVPLLIGSFVVTTFIYMLKTY